jgi:pyruvate dehydrogenase E1 component beta subunit
MHSWVTNVPGLKVVTPSNSADAKELLKASIEDDNPVVFIEDRSIHREFLPVEAENRPAVLGKAQIMRHGVDVSIFAAGALVQDALKAARALDVVGVSSEVMDLRTFSPLDLEAILKSVDKTRGFLVLDNAHSSGSFGESLIGRINRSRPLRSGSFCKLVAWPDFPQPTSSGSIKNFYPDPGRIFREIIEMFSLESSDKLRASLAMLSEDAQGSYAGPF